MIRITEILDKVLEYNPDADLDVIDRAYVYSARVHDGQVRLSGEPYLSHPLEVAGILTEMKLDADSIAAGLLHDVIEDTHASEEQILETFGKDVTHIVSGVTKISKLTFQTSQERQAENIRKMILAMADDIRVIMVKLADRVHNMRTLQFQSAPKQKRIARETLDIYAPIAARLGIYWIKQELEDISFRYLMSEEYEWIKHKLDKDRKEGETYIETVKGLIREKMEQSGLHCEVVGRHKQYYSIYEKMQKQNLGFDEIYDIIAFRILLDTVPQCYEALGVIHAMWRPIQKKFKDYIGVPKANLYQSLHTTVNGLHGERIEIQIRTREMDRIAKAGIAAHWSYKEGREETDRTKATFAWIQNLVENQEVFKDPDEFLENLRIDLFPEDIYVFTPRGEVNALPRGATPVDFAYMIHTELGHQCTGAKVNGRMVGLQYELNTGDMVQIVTTKGHNPSKDWLKFVQTVKARSRIRQWIKAQEKERSNALGREMCEKAFQKYKMSFNALMKTEDMVKVAQSFGFKTIEDLLENVGYGKITPLQILRKIEPRTDVRPEDSSIFQKMIGRVRKKRPRDGVVVKGLNDILIRFGKCCRPVPGDPISGYITRGQGVTVHRSNCVNALKMNPERRIDVSWDVEIAEHYPVRIRLRSNDRSGLLGDIANTITKNGVNIIQANTATLENNVVDSYFTLLVTNTEQLRKVVTDLKKIKNVQAVTRLNT